jgi:hypothetical protein
MSHPRVTAAAVVVVLLGALVVDDLAVKVSSNKINPLLAPFPFFPLPRSVNSFGGSDQLCSASTTTPPYPPPPLTSLLQWFFRPLSDLQHVDNCSTALTPIWVLVSLSLLNASLLSCPPSQQHTSRCSDAITPIRTVVWLLLSNALVCSCPPLSLPPCYRFQYCRSGTSGHFSFHCRLVFLVFTMNSTSSFTQHRRRRLLYKALGRLVWLKSMAPSILLQLTLSAVLPFGCMCHWRPYNPLLIRSSMLWL